MKSFFQPCFDFSANNLYSDCIPIKDIRANLKNINVVFIVLEVGPPTVTKENRVVRTFKVADATACINVSVWDEPGSLLVPGDIVRLTKGYAAIWRSCLTLYSGKNGDILKIGDFCLAFNEHLNMSEPNPNHAPTGPMNQSKNQLPINNGNVPNNGNAPTSNVPPQLAHAPAGNVPLTSTTTISNTSSPAKVNASIRHATNPDYAAKQSTTTTNTKPNARSARSNQTRNHVKNERR